MAMSNNWQKCHSDWESEAKNCYFSCYFMLGNYSCDFLAGINPGVFWGFLVGGVFVGLVWFGLIWFDFFSLNMHYMDILEATLEVWIPWQGGSGEIGSESCWYSSLMWQETMSFWTWNVLTQACNAYISTSQIVQVKENVNAIRNVEADSHQKLMQLKICPQYCAHG